MHPEADAFLDAIFDHPDDDTPRLVYADWLEERGHENYARFIRLQCTAAREKPWSDEANRLWEEIGRVWNRLYDDWSLASSLELIWIDAVHFERGFLRTDVILGDQQIEEIANYWAGFLIGEVCLLNVSDLAWLAESSISKQLRKVSLSRGADSEWQDSDDQCLDKFVHSEFTRKIRVLDLSHVSMRQAMIKALLLPDALRDLRELRISFPERADCNPDEATKQLEACFELVARH